MPLVSIRQNRYGNVEIDPVSERLARRARRHLVDTGARPARSRDSLVCLQGDNGDTFLDADIPPRAAREVREGYTVRCRVSGELFAALIGYDFA